MCCDTTHVVIWRVFHSAKGKVPGVGTRPKLSYNARHKLKIWTLRDLKTSEKRGLRDLKRVFGKFEIGGLKYLNHVIEANCQAWVLNC